MRDVLEEFLWIALAIVLGLLLSSLFFGCAVSHGGASCEDAHERLRELQCVEGYATEAEFAPVCAVIDADCAVEATDCTEARACRR